MSSHWISDLSESTKKLPVSGSLRVDDFVLKISAYDQGFIGWAEQYLAPLALPVPNDSYSTPRFTVGCLYSDDLVSQAISDLQNNLEAFLRLSGYGRRAMYIGELDNGEIQVSISPEEGLVWLVNRETRSLTLVYSSRTTWASLEFARTVRDVIGYFLEIDGWLICHAGAVSTGDENILIIGDEGAGKTTLILALLDSGAHYLANELLFAKPTAEGMRVLPFAIPIAIGMGTALQFEKLIELLEKPYNFFYPPRRLKTSRLEKYKQKEWAKLNDKLQLLPSELGLAFPKAESLSGMTIDRIVVPDVCLEKVSQRAEQLPRERVVEVVKNNVIPYSDKNFSAPWLRLESSKVVDELKAEDSLVESSLNLPAIKLTYHVSKDSKKLVIG